MTARLSRLGMATHLRRHPTWAIAADHALPKGTLVLELCSRRHLGYEWTCLLTLDDGIFWAHFNYAMQLEAL